MKRWNWFPVVLIILCPVLALLAGCTAKSDNEMLRNEIDALTEAYETLNEKYDSLKGDYDELRDNNEAIKRELSEIHSDIDIVDSLLGNRELFSFVLMPSSWWHQGRNTYCTPEGYEDFSACDYGKDGNSFIFAGRHEEGRFIAEIDRNYELKWSYIEKDGDIASGAYNQATDMLIAHRETSAGVHSIVELKDGQIIRELESVGGHKLGRVERLYWDSWDNDKFWGVDSSNHWVFLTDFTGTKCWSFGEYGIAGDDAAHLNTPKTIALTRMKKPSGDSIYIGDWGNNRILNIMYQDKSILLTIPLEYADVSNAPMNHIAIRSDRYDSSLGIFYAELALPSCIHFWTPASNLAIANPTDPQRMLVSRYQGFAERYLTDSTERINPAIIPLFDSATANASIPVYSPILPDWFRPKKTFIITSTQAGKMEIEVARMSKTLFGQPSAVWDGRWDIIETVNLDANKPSEYWMSHPIGIFRLKITLNSDGIINGWADLEP